MLYNLILAAAWIASLLFLPLLFLTGPRYRAGLRERLGDYDPPLAKLTPGSRPIWIHAASVGEVRSVLPFIDELKNQFTGRRIVVSTFTSTGNRVARDSNRADHVLFLPLDLVGVVRRALTTIDPSVLIIVETEIWPNLLRETYRRGMPVLLLSGRLSARALRRYRCFGGFFRQVINFFAALGMQSPEDADRVKILGAESARVAVTGSFKHLHSTARSKSILPEKAESRGHVRLVVGSSHRGEEEILLAVFVALRPRYPKLQMILAPRHPQRFPEVEKILTASGLGFVKKSEMNGRSGFSADLVFLDTIGDLEKFYAHGDIAFIGGSLVNAGGHNLLEPARYRQPVLFGPHVENFQAVAEEMKRSGAGIEVAGTEDLVREISWLLDDPVRRRAMGEKAYRLAAEEHGVLERSMGLVSRYLS